jgi:hypothetical protein
MDDKAGEYDEDFDTEIERMAKMIGAVITRNEVIGLPTTLLALRRVLDANAAVCAALAEEFRRMH